MQKTFDFDMKRVNEIKIPENIDNVIKESYNRANKKRGHKWVKVVSAVAACLLIFIFSVNASPALAEYASKVPGLEYLVRLVSFDKGLRNAIENGYTQHIDKSSTDKDIKFKVKDIIFDKKSLVIAYSIEDLNKKYNDMDVFPEVKFYIGNELKDIPCFINKDSSPNESFKNKGIREGIIRISFKPELNEIPDTVVLKADEVRAASKTDNNDNRLDEKISGNWTVEFNVNKSLAKTEPEIIDINKTEKIGPFDVTVETIKVYPTAADLIVTFKSDNYTCPILLNPRLVDNKGVEYKTDMASIDSEYKRTYTFESTYFSDAKSLKLKVDGIHYIEKDKQFITIDLKNNKIINPPFSGIQLNKIEHNTKHGDEKIALLIEFKITDKELLSYSGKPGWYVGGMDFEKAYYDDKEEYIPYRYYEGPYKDELITGICLKDFKGTDTIKLKISALNKGTIESKEFKIK